MRRLANRAAGLYAQQLGCLESRMLALFRRFLNTWAARALFIVLIASFGLWGISGTIEDLSRDNALATVGAGAESRQDSGPA